MSGKCSNWICATTWPAVGASRAAETIGVGAAATSCRRIRRSGTQSIERGLAPWNLDQRLAFVYRGVNARMHRMRNLSLAVAALPLSVSVAAAQNAPAPRIDGEGINMDAAPPPTKEPNHPADLVAPNTALLPDRRRGGHLHPGIVAPYATADARRCSWRSVDIHVRCLSVNCRNPGS